MEAVRNKKASQKCLDSGRKIDGTLPILDKNLAEYIAAAGAGAWVPRHFTIKRRRKSWQPKKDKMIPSEKERKRALKYATPAGTGRMWVMMGIAFIIFGIILPLIPIGLVISEASAQRYDPKSIHTATLVFYLLGAFFGFCGCFCIIFGKLAVKAFTKMLSKGEINYPVAEYKTPKKLLLQEAAAINQSPNAPLTASIFGNWIDFEADWQNCLSIHNGILQSHQIFKKLILVQDNFTYKELDYENNSELGIGVKTFAAGSTTTIGRMKGHKLIYNISMNLSNGKLGVNGYSIDTVDITNEVHKWLADHGYTRVD